MPHKQARTQTRGAVPRLKRLNAPVKVYKRVTPSPPPPPPSYYTRAKARAAQAAAAALNARNRAMRALRRSVAAGRDRVTGVKHAAVARVTGAVPPVAKNAATLLRAEKGSNAQKRAAAATANRILAYVTAPSTKPGRGAGKAVATAAVIKAIKTMPAVQVVGGVVAASLAHSVAHVAKAAVRRLPARKKKAVARSR